MLSATSFSAAAFCGAPVRGAARITRSAAAQQRRQRLHAVENAALAQLLSLSSPSIGLQQRQRYRQCRLSPCLAAQASAAQSTELPPELKRIVTAFSMV